MGLLAALRQMGMAPPMREGTAEVIASVLTNTDQAARVDIVSKIAAARWRAQVADILKEGQGPGAGYAGAAAATQ